MKFYKKKKVYYLSCMIEEPFRYKIRLSIYYSFIYLFFEPKVTKESVFCYFVVLDKKKHFKN